MGTPLSTNSPLAGVHDRLSRRVVLVHCAGVAVELLQRAEHRVHGLIAVPRGKLQDAVHLRRRLARRTGAKHREGNQQAAGRGHHVPVGAVAAVGQQGLAEAQGGGPEGAQFSGISRTVHRNPLHAVGLQEPGRRRRTGGERHQGTRRRDPSHTESSSFFSPWTCPAGTGGNRLSPSVNQPACRRTMPVGSRFAVVLVSPRRRSRTFRNVSANAPAFPAPAYPRDMSEER